MGKGKTIIAVGLASLALSSCGLFYADEPAPELEIPTLREIESVYVGSASDSYERTDEATKQRAIEFFQSAIPTKRESVNDSPTREVYYLIRVKSSENDWLYRGYFYEDKRFFGLVSEWYYEIPYYGIYAVSEEAVLALIEDEYE